MVETVRSLKTVAIAGNPNSGKTTIFNRLAGTRHKVANYPGVTVERIEAELDFPGGQKIRLVDLPGCYSLTARSLEEQIAHDLLLGRIEGLEAPALVLDVVDASNLERNLYLATQLLDQKIPLVVVLNMMDIAEERGFRIDPDKLSQALGCPVIPTVGRKGRGIDRLVESIEKGVNGSHRTNGVASPLIDDLPESLERAVGALAPRFESSRGSEARGRSRAEALWALLSNLDGDDAVRLPPQEVEWVRQTRAEFDASGDELRKEESKARYGYIGKLVEAAEIREDPRPASWTDKIDAVLLHRIFGPLFLALIFAFIFQSVFAWAGPAMDLVDGAFGSLAAGIDRLLPDSMLKGLLIDGVIAGVGNTVIFLPQILILFFFLGLLDDSGYLSRAAFLLDRMMSSIGLSGKAFVPLLSSFACAVPGIMATRTIPNRKDRLVTILVAPLMACSARLPVYILLIGTVFEAERRVFGVLNLGGLIMFGLYLAGILGAVAMALLFKRTILKSPKPALILEMPTYKLPTLRSTLTLLWDRSLIFLRRVGTVILAITVILWGLLSFPKDSRLAPQFEARRAEIASSASLSENAKEQALAEIDNLQAEADLQNSFGGQLGRTLEPVIAPLGFDWKIGLGLIASFAAREVFVSTMGVIYGVGSEADEESVSLREKLQAETRLGTGLPLYTPLVGLSLLVFYVFACQCMSTVAIVRRETMSWRWPLFMVGYMTAMAWVASFGVYQFGRLMGYQ